MSHRESILPIGVVSKNDIGEWRTWPRAALNKLREAIKPTILEESEYLEA
jgi:hypothetical protein